MAAATTMQVGETGRSVDLALLAHVPESVTLLELVDAIGTITDDDELVVDTVINMLTCGRVQLCGNFRGSRSEDLRA